MLKHLLLLAILPLILISVFNTELYAHVPSSPPEFDVVISYAVIQGGTQINLTFSEIDIHYKITVLQNGEPLLQQTVHSMELTASYLVDAFSSNEFPIETQIDFLEIGIQDSNNVFLTITTDKPSYLQGETITITGQTPSTYNILNISLSSPIDGQIETISNITINNNQFVTSMNTGNNTSIYTATTYTLTASYGTDVASTTFDYSHPVPAEDEYFIPPQSYLILSDKDISKWNRQIVQWENAQNRTDHKTEILEKQLGHAEELNDLDKIEVVEEKLGSSMALSTLYGELINCLEEQIELLS